MSRSPWFYFLGGTVGLGLLTALMWTRWDYFGLPEMQRPFHPRYQELRSGAGTGLLCGLAGSLLFLLNLAYLLRKKLLLWKWLGSLRAWMAFHIFTGLLGAGLIVVHSGLIVRSSLGMLASIAMLVAVATGLLGRYIYAQVPRSLGGRELERADLARRLEEHRVRLVDAGIDLTLLDEAPALPEVKGVLGRLAGVFAGRRETKQQYRVLRKRIRERRDLRHLLPIARRYARELQWQARYSELRGLMGSWRFLHRWLAVVMLAVVVFHVYIGVRYGDVRWPF